MTTDQGSRESRCVCGSDDFDRVTVTRADSSLYCTDFVACSHCRVMFYRPPPPSATVAPKPARTTDWTDRYRASMRAKK